MNPHSLETSTAVSTTYTAIIMGVVIILLVSALIIMIMFIIRSRFKIQRILREIKSKEKEKIQLYEEVNQSEIIDSMKNVAYEPPSLPQRRQT